MMMWRASHGRISRLQFLVLCCFCSQAAYYLGLQVWPPREWSKHNPNMESGGSSAGQYPRPQSPQGAPYPDPMNRNPHLPQPRAPRLTQEEINILEECNTESFWYRCVPLGMAFGGTTTYLVKTGHLKPHPRYGSTLKALGAVFLGYVMGKLSYQSTCQQKILDKIPHTNLAQSVRKNRGLPSVYEDQPMADADSDPGYRSDRTKDSYSSMDTSPDITSRNVKELDDNMRPSLDREVKAQDEAATDPQKTLTYDELRQRNRQEYERNMATSPNSPFRQRPFPPPGPPSPSSTPSEPSSAPAPPPPGSKAIWDSPPPESPGRAFDSSRGQKKNQYGDVWDSN